MDQQDPLSQLADIHLPAPVSAWPPAIGWWLVLIIALILLFFLIRLVLRIVRRYRDYRLQRAYALKQLTEHYQHYLQQKQQAKQPQNQLRQAYLNHYNQLLRRIALKLCPQAQVAGLAGQEWMNFLAQSGAIADFQQSQNQNILNQAYSKQCEVDIEQLNVLGQKWIENIYQRCRKEKFKLGPNLGLGSRNK